AGCPRCAQRHRRNPAFDVRCCTILPVPSLLQSAQERVILPTPRRDCNPFPLASMLRQRSAASADAITLSPGMSSFATSAGFTQPSQQEREASVQNAPRPALNVLLVEDSPEYARFVIEMLRETAPLSISLTHAARLQQALEYLRAGGFNAILLDL